MEHLSVDELKSLYFKYARYRDSECGGRAEISIMEFYKRYGI
jgi:hypothetical protein